MAVVVKAKEIKSEKQAAAALERIEAIKEEIAELRESSGITKLEAELDATKEKVTEFMASKNVERVDVSGSHATLVRQYYGGVYVGTEDDLPADAPDDLIPLRQIIRDKFGPLKKGGKSLEIWHRVTERVVVKEKVEEVVAEGILTLDEIAPSFYEKAKKPFVRIFKDGE